MPGPVELLGHQASIPIEDCVRPGNARDLFQGFASESLSDLGQGGSLGIGQAQSSGQVCSEDAVLGWSR